MVQRTIAETIVDSVGTGDDTAVVAVLEDVITDGVATKPQIVALASLTGTVGTANDAMIAVPASTLATDFATQKTSVDAAITAINNNLADLQAKVNAIIAALKA